MKLMPIVTIADIDITTKEQYLIEEKHIVGAGCRYNNVDKLEYCKGGIWREVRTGKKFRFDKDANKVYIN